MSDTPNADIAEMSFEHALAELERIVARLENELRTLLLLFK